MKDISKVFKIIRCLYIIVKKKPLTPYILSKKKKVNYFEKKIKKDLALKGKEIHTTTILFFFSKTRRKTMLALRELHTSVKVIL